jgi:cytoskeletal protein CcmA (bactofilin family)
MGATYTRQSSSAIVDGAVIEAADINAEFDQILAAFAVTSGHTHDGTAAEGGPITKLLGTAITIGDATSGTDIAVTFDGESADGVLTWMEDEDYFKFSDDILMNSTERLNFGDTGTYIHQSADGVLDLVSDTEIEINATTIDINGAVAMDGAITGATNITLSGELDAATGDFSGDVDIDGTLEADAITINGTAIGSIYGAVAGSSSIVTTGALDSGSITSGFGTIDTGSSTITTTGLITGGSLDIDDVLINGTTIGHTDDTDLMTLASGVLTVAGELDATTLDISGNADIDGTTNLDAVDIDGAVQLDATLTVGVDDQGYDVKLFGDTASAYMLWDTSADDLILGGAAGLIVPDGQFTLGSTAVTSTAAEINLIDGDTARGTTAVADADGILHNDGGTMRMTSAATFKTYFTSGVSSAADDLTAGDSAVNLTTSSGDITIDAAANDSDIIFKGTDNSSDITMLTLDGSEAGAATFNNKIIATELDISGDVDVDGTLEADAITIDGATLAETISDTVGAMVSSNTETGITVTYQDGDNTLDFALGAAQTTITSLLATDIKIGEDDETKIDFETADEIHFYAANVEQVYLGDNIFGPQSDSDVDLGSSSVRWKDAYIDTITTTSAITSGAGVVIADAGNIGSASDTDAIAIASNGVVTFSQAPVFPDGSIAVVDLDIDGATDIGEDIVDADLFIVDNGAGGTNRKVAASRIKTYIGGGTQWQAVKTSNFTASAGQGVFCNTTSAAFTLTLPAGSIGDEVTFVDYAGTFDTNNLTIAANGSEKIHGSTDDLTVSVERAANTLVFTDSTQGWLLKSK